jgi:ribonuclease P protein subunit POP4
MSSPSIPSNVSTSLLSRAHSPTSTTRIYSEKIKNRPLHLKPTEPSNARNLRRIHRATLKARKKKLKPAPLSAREKRSLGIYDLPPSERKYSIYEPLHRMWVAYIQEVLGESCMPVGPSTVARLVSADFHGAEVEVVRSRCVSRVGVRGIVVRDMKFVFVVVGRGNKVRVVPKEHTVFRFEVPAPVRQVSGKSEDAQGIREEGAEGEDKAAEMEKKNLVFELHGDQFRYRAADRANKKFKTHFLPDL